jgi:hypothetical protein
VVIRISPLRSGWVVTVLGIAALTSLSTSAGVCPLYFALLRRADRDGIAPAWADPEPAMGEGAAATAAHVADCPVPTSHWQPLRYCRDLSFDGLQPLLDPAIALVDDLSSIKKYLASP